MPIAVTDLTDALRHSRAHFLKHIDGVAGDSWTWKPYPECKSLTETLQHLVVDDRSALESIKTGEFPDFDSHRPEETDPAALLAILADTHAALLSHIETEFGSSALDTPICIWGGKMPLALGVTSLTSEDHYHAGQAAFIRMAVDPAWDYYAAVYGLPSS
jgi:hypothetical protein